MLHGCDIVSVPPKLYCEFPGLGLVSTSIDAGLITFNGSPRLAPDNVPNILCTLAELFWDESALVMANVGEHDVEGASG